jgi:uncharacterized coiled-coil protein SlyX
MGKRAAMKRIALVGLLMLGAAVAQAQIASPARAPMQAASPADARLAELEKRLQHLETENAALKEQVSHQKTSIKAIDMVLTDFKATYVTHVGDYDKHVHFINHFTFGGMVPGKIYGDDGRKTMVVIGGAKQDLWSGTPNQPSNSPGPKK